MKTLGSWMGTGLCAVLLSACGGGGSGDTAAPAYVHLQTVRDCQSVYCPVMSAIAPGSFTMGSLESEFDREDDEGPQHKVSFNYWLAVAKNEVTFAQWDACVADGGCNAYTPTDESWGRDSRPAINVSWDDAHAYLAWLNAKTGRTYRLLSESEWEYAARAGANTAYPWGSAMLADQANYDSILGATAPVGSYPANAWGLFDMAGNTWEWTQDRYHDTYTDGPADGTAWESGSEEYRVLRGGGWADNAAALRSAYRNYNSPTNRDKAVGFRVARTLF